MRHLSWLLGFTAFAAAWSAGVAAPRFAEMPG